jgi:hypothetical protein
MWADDAIAVSAVFSKGGLTDDANRILDFREKVVELQQAAIYVPVFGLQVLPVDSELHFFPLPFINFLLNVKGAMS